jgi:hypothetical protein
VTGPDAASVQRCRELMEVTELDLELNDIQVFDCIGLDHSHVIT